MIYKQTFGISGRYNVQVLKHGEVVRETGWFKNMILDTGIDCSMQNNSPVTAGLGSLQYCRVGTGTAAPAVTDTDLQTQASGTAGWTSTIFSTVNTNPVTPNWISIMTRTWDFAVGAHVGLALAEVGVGWKNGTVGNTGGLYSRARIVDGGGTPTTITLLADEQLRVVYEFRLQVTLTDATGSFSITGVGSRNYTMRPGNISTLKAWYFISAGIGQSWSGNAATGYTGSIGAITSSPSGTLGSSGGVTWGSYTLASLQRDLTFVFATGGANGNIKSIAFPIRTSQDSGTDIMYWQMEMDTAVTKTNLQTFSLTFRFSVVRL